MAAHDRVSTGSVGFDLVIDGLRLGDNVVWQVDAVEDYARMVDAYVAQAREDGRRLVYLRFGTHPPLVEDGPNTVTYQVDPTHGLRELRRRGARSCGQGGLAGLLRLRLPDRPARPYWHSDLMIGNFFKVTCPFLYELDTVAYFAHHARHPHLLDDRAHP